VCKQGISDVEMPYAISAHVESHGIAVPNQLHVNDVLQNEFDVAHIVATYRHTITDITYKQAIIAIRHKVNRMNGMTVDDTPQEGTYSFHSLYSLVFKIQHVTNPH
jgi:hypothetical protein